MTLFEALKTIKANGPTHDLGGICDNIEALLPSSRCESTQLLHEFKTLYLQWPGFSGRLVFPVPSPNPAFSAGDMYGMAKGTDMWDANSTYGRSRWDLLNWCIKQLENTQ